MTDQLRSVRRTFDERLIALEAGLADPESSPALESLVLDLVRAAGDEAEAAARDAVLHAQRNADATLATAVAQAQAAQVQLDIEREHAASLRAEIASLKDQRSTIAGLQQSLDEATRAAADAADSLASASARADAATREHDALAADRDALAAERDAFAADRDTLLSERSHFVRAHDAMVLQRDTLVHERDDIVRDRDRQIAQLHEDLTAREAALKEARAKAAAAPAKKSSPEAPADGPVRKAGRQAFSDALGVQIDGEAALLVDLSLTGAQVLSCSALKPTKTVKMLLPSSDSPVLCRGRIVWARLEPTMPGRPIRYRAGMFFTATDQAAVQTFISRHGTDGAHAAR